MIHSKNDMEKRLEQLKQAVPMRGMERHPSTLKHTSELPAELQSPVLQSISASEDIKKIISFPQQIHRGHHYVPKQALIFTGSDVFHVLASIWPNQAPQITYLRGEGLMYMQVTLILLYGFLEIVAPGSASPTRLGIEFNTVAWDQFSQPVRQLLQAAKDVSAVQANITRYSPTVNHAVSLLPLKFFNGLRIHGILPGEQLEDLVFQSSTWEQWLVIFRKAILANTLLLLTSNYMVIIREELKVAQGWIVTYVPRKSIASIISKAGSKWNELEIQLKQDDQTTNYKFLVTFEAAKAWRQSWIQHGGEWHELPAELNDHRPSRRLYAAQEHKNLEC